MVLTREQAGQQLEAFQTPDWPKLCLAEIEKTLPAPLQSCAYALLNRDEQGQVPTVQTHGYERMREYYEKRQHRLRQLASMTAEERLAIFTALVPRVAQTCEATWQLLGRLPYQQGYYRRAFRVPASHQAHVEKRVNWMQEMLVVLARYREQDVLWFAQWAPYLMPQNTRQFGFLFAAAIEEGGEQGQAIFDLLMATARGEQENSTMGRHVTTALLVVEREEGWECMGRLLLAAQREEGLRQVILETVDEAHPQAFRHMVRLILEHDLLRFSATVRAADVWLGFDREVEHVADLRLALRTILELLDDAERRREKLARGNPQEVFLALWSTGFTDAGAAINASQPLLTDELAERRLAAVHLLGMLTLAEARPALLGCLADPDLRVALHAFAYLSQEEEHSDLFEPGLRLLARLRGEHFSAASGIWPWLTIESWPSRLLSTLLDALGKRDPRLLLPYLSQMSEWERVSLIKRLAELPEWDEEVHAALYRLLGERTRRVSEQALEAIASKPIAEADVPELEQLLTRKGVELRRGLITLLLKREDEAVLGSINRLLTRSHALQRLAGLDLIHGLLKQQRQGDQALALANAYAEMHARLTSEEAALLETIRATSTAREELKPEQVLGLIRPEQRTPVVTPRKLLVTVDTPAARACLLALNALIEEHSTTPILLKTWSGHVETLLGNIQHYFPTPDAELSREEDEQANLPLAELWLRWERERPASLRDEDGLELWRAALILQGTRAASTPAITSDQQHSFSSFYINTYNIADNDDVEKKREEETLQLRQRNIITTLLFWLRCHREMPGVAVDFVLDTAEAAMASVDFALMTEQETDLDKSEWERTQLRSSFQHDGGLILALQALTWHRSAWKDEHLRRLWQLMHWRDEPVPGWKRLRPELELLMDAWKIGAANEADIIDQLAGPRGKHAYYDDLQVLSTRTPSQAREQFPILDEIVSRLRARILEIELRRGEMPTPATDLARSLRYSGGTAVFVRLVSLLEPVDLVRGYARDNDGKRATWSHLLRVSFPDPGEALEEFARQVREARLPAERLVAAALYVPQWARQIGYVLGWPHFTEAVWWIYAHTKGNHWTVDEEIRQGWQNQVAEHTQISADELLDGAVDVSWFRQSYRELGAERWEQVYAAAKYASDGAGHSRARLYADAMLGKSSTLDLRERLLSKRQPDVARALGLIPLPEDEQARQAEIEERYGIFQEFKRTGKGFGSQRRASEETAVRIGMENLARTAGFPDPQRLQWAMEARSMPELRAGWLEIHVDEVTLRLELDELAAVPRLIITGGKGKQLKTLPTRLKKHQEVQELLDRKRAIEQQIARIRPTLEAAMCRGDSFTARELGALLEHPVLSRLLRNLVFFLPARDGQDELAGYPQMRDSQLVLCDHAGNLAPIDAGETRLRLAHPYDLFASRTWHAWQHQCFTSGRTQPFKQVFRELYVCTSNEARNGDDALSQRYHGQQVQPRLAQALLNQRGWVLDEEMGARRTFHAEKLTAVLSFTYGGFTPSEVEGRTVGDVFFLPRGEYKPLALASVPPRVFSETMRDLDLLVSVAHSGGVDPEATASTVEMRAALVSETCELLGLTNVTLKGSHVLIAGTRGNYNVHLGSAVVHRQPGGALCIIPVHAQHRGRIFLPFADNDPKTAEVITKVITLARDQEIKDPTILEQLV
jgi:hypothetical protein